MPSTLRLLVAVAAALTLGAGCSQETVPGSPGSGTTSAGDDGPSALVEGTCWTATPLGADPQDVLKLSERFDVPYLAAARAVATRPAFSERRDCGKDHEVEVFKVVRLPKLDQRLTDYATLLRIQSSLYGKVSRSVAQACMTKPLAQAVAKSGLPNAVMTPALPAEAAVGWAPASPDQWSAGQRVFACTLTWAEPGSERYAEVFTRAFPTAKRTCIDNRRLVFVDCARDHERERIAVIEASEAVAAGVLPGAKAIRSTPNGRVVDIGEAQYTRLDAACTSYLRAISTTKKLTGVANVDADEWPAPGGSYPVYCDADMPPEKNPVVTRGSVYDR